MDSGSTEDLSPEDFITIRRQLSEGQNLLRETVDRLRQSQETNDMLVRRRDELEARVTTLETDYEELLGKWLPFKNNKWPIFFLFCGMSRKDHKWWRNQQCRCRWHDGGLEGLLYILFLFMLSMWPATLIYRTNWNFNMLRNGRHSWAKSPTLSSNWRSETMKFAASMLQSTAWKVLTKNLR